MDTTTTASTSELRIDDLLAVAEKMKPLPRKEFIYDGMVHAIYENGRMRLSALFMQKLKAIAPPVKLAMPDYSGMECVLDPDLPYKPR